MKDGATPPTEARAWAEACTRKGQTNAADCKAHHGVLGRADARDMAGFGRRKVPLIHVPDQAIRPCDTLGDSGGETVLIPIGDTLFK